MFLSEVQVAPVSKKTALICPVGVPFVNVRVAINLYQPFPTSMMEAVTPVAGVTVCVPILNVVYPQFPVPSSVSKITLEDVPDLAKIDRVMVSPAEKETDPVLMT